MRPNCTGCLKEPCNLEFSVWCSRCYFLSTVRHFGFDFICVLSQVRCSSPVSWCSASSLVICWGGNMGEEEGQIHVSTSKIEISFSCVEQLRIIWALGHVFSFIGRINFTVTHYTCFLNQGPTRNKEQKRKKRERNKDIPLVYNDILENFLEDLSKFLFSSLFHLTFFPLSYPWENHHKKNHLSTLSLNILEVDLTGC